MTKRLPKRPEKDPNRPVWKGIPAEPKREIHERELKRNWREHMDLAMETRK